MICIMLFASSLRPIRSMSLFSRRNSVSWALLQSALKARPPRSLSLTPSRSPLLIICVAAASASEGTMTARASNVGDSLLNPQFKPCFHIGAHRHGNVKLVEAASLDDFYLLLSSLLFRPSESGKNPAGHRPFFLEPLVVPQDDPSPILIDQLCGGCRRPIPGVLAVRDRDRPPPPPSDAAEPTRPRPVDGNVKRGTSDLEVNSGVPQLSWKFMFQKYLHQTFFRILSLLTCVLASLSQYLPHEDEAARDADESHGRGDAPVVPRVYPPERFHPAEETFHGVARLQGM